MDRYHVKFGDKDSGEELGLLLNLGGYSKQLSNPYAAKTAIGDTKNSDLTEWTVESQTDWRGGRGQDEAEVPEQYYDSHHVETRIEGQLTLGPLANAPQGSGVKYEPGNTTPFGVGRQGEIIYPVGQYTNFDTEIYNGRNYDFKLKFGFTDFTNYLTTVRIWLRREGMPGAVIRLALYNDANGAIGGIVGFVDVAAAAVGVGFAWIDFTFAAPLAVQPNTNYWIRLSTTSLRAVGYYVTLWAVIGGVPRRIYQLAFTPIQRAMSFLGPGGGLTCTSVQIFAKKLWTPGTYTVALYSDDGGGLPNAMLRTANVDMNAQLLNDYYWLIVTWGASYNLAAGTRYHIVVIPPAAADTHGSISWGGNAAGGYASGASSMRVGAAAWAAQTADLYFRINSDVLEDDVVKFVRYDDKIWVAAGDTVYYWNVDQWTASDTVAGDDITDMESWGGYIWVARGAASVVRRKLGAGAWANVAGIFADLLKSMAGYLYRTDGVAGNGHHVMYTADGAAWSDPIVIGSGDYEVTALEGYKDIAVCATPIRLWGIAGTIPYVLLSWASQEDADNGKGMIAWSKTNCLYIPLRYGLYRWNGDSMSAVGPEQGVGLPANRSGKIKSLVGTNNWLYCGIDAGATGYSSVMAYGAMGGWHEVQRCEQVGERTYAVFFETLNSPNRLWYGMSEQTRYLLLPDFTDNPYGWTGYSFTPSGELITSWFGSELVEVVKDLHKIVIRGEGITASTPVDVFYEVDRSAVWTYLGRMNISPEGSLPFVAPTWGYKELTTGSTTATIELDAAYDTTDMAIGDWVRIDGEIRQVASITDGDTFVLTTPLSSIPDVNTRIYVSRPAGREFRLKLVLYSNDKTVTPKVKTVFIRFQNNVLDRYVYRLPIRIEDNMRDLSNGSYPHTAADLRVLLDTWSRRETPFSFYDPDGVEHTVKITNAGEGGLSLAGGEGANFYTSMYNIVLVEME